MWKSWWCNWWNSFVSLTYLTKWQISKSAVHVKLEILDLVFILCLTCKLQPGYVTVMMMSLIKFFVSLTYLTKFDVICASRTWDTRSSPHFVSGLQIVARSHDSHDDIIDEIFCHIYIFQTTWVVVSSNCFFIIPDL